MSALSELLNSKKPEDWSGRRVGRELRTRGLEISDATVALYLNGEHSLSPSEDTLRAFHELWNIPMRRLREAAGVPLGEEEPWRVPAEANRLNRRQRIAMRELILSLVEPEEAENDPGATISKLPRRDSQQTNRSAKAAYSGNGEAPERVRRSRKPHST